LLTRCQFDSFWVVAMAYFKKNLVLYNEELSLERTIASAEITGVWGGSTSVV